MTINPVLPGCYASPLFYSANAQECDACALRLECARIAQERVSPLLDKVQRFDACFDQERSGSVARWIARRWKRDRSGDAKRTAARETLESWKRVGLNIYELKHRMNPAFPTEPGLKAAFQFIIDNGSGFTRRDIIEELVEETDMTKAGAKRLTDTVADALVEAGILKQENRGILCLNK